MRTVSSAVSPLEWFSPDESPRLVRLCLNNLKGRALLCLTETQFDLVRTGGSSAPEWLDVVWEYIDTNPVAHIPDNFQITSDIVIEQSGLESSLESLIDLNIPTLAARDETTVMKISFEWLMSLLTLSTCLSIVDNYCLIGLINRNGEAVGRSGLLQIASLLQEFPRCNRLEIFGVNPFADRYFSNGILTCPSCKPSSKLCTTCHKKIDEELDAFEIECPLPAALQLNFVIGDDKTHSRNFIFRIPSINRSGDGDPIEIALSVGKGAETFRCSSGNHKSSSKCTDQARDPQLFWRSLNATSEILALCNKSIIDKIEFEFSHEA